jgi:hypothetical protein
VEQPLVLKRKVTQTQKPPTKIKLVSLEEEKEKEWMNRQKPVVVCPGSGAALASKMRAALLSKVLPRNA